MFVFSYRRLIRNSAFKSVDYVDDRYIFKHVSIKKKNLFKETNQGCTNIYYIIKTFLNV